MSNEQNLIPIEQVNSRRSREEHSKDSSKGGKKSGEVRRQKKKMKETMNMILSLDLPESKSKETLKEIGFEDEDLNVQTAILMQQAQKAMNGNLDSAKFVKDVSDELNLVPEENKEKQYKVLIPARDLPPAFINIYRDVINHRYLEYWLEGGRASLKSTFVSEAIVELLENNPNMCAIVIRRYTNTMRDSVYAQMTWALDKLGETYYELPDEYDELKSPLEITKASTGQKIYFRGTDDAGKIKSIKPPKGMYIGVIWYEEFDQIQGMNTVRKINQSIVRGGNDFWIFYTYNTPTSKNHFVNKEKRKIKKNRIVHKSDYTQAPIEWIGQAFIDEAEFIKETSPNTYENEYLGNETGDGGSVFENLEIREITDEEIASFDWIYRGIDWGWYPDPFHYSKMHFDAARRILYIFDEYRCNKKSNANTWEILHEEKGVDFDDLITADSAENKSIGDYKEYGSLIRGAEKGPNSVEYSMKWLAGLSKIVIDRVRCPATAEEFESYELEQDKDGNYITGYPDENNHAIDSVRYATERIWKRRGQ